MRIKLTDEQRRVPEASSKIPRLREGHADRDSHDGKPIKPRPDHRCHKFRQHRLPAESPRGNHRRWSRSAFEWKMMMSILRFPTRTYTSKLFEVGQFKIAGTLDGFIDFACAEGTYQLDTPTALMLAAALECAVRDIEENCLYDKDALLEPRI